MELKALLRFLIRKSWIILPITALTIGAAYYFTRQQTPLYSAKSTYITKINAQLLDSRSLMTALDIYNRNTEIQTTYAEVAMSRRVKDIAAGRVGFPNGAPKSYSVSSRGVAGTNILEITVEGPDPDVAARYANALGDETISYANNLYTTYLLEPLDQALAPRAPSKPNPMLNYAIGGVLGLILGLGIAILSAYLRSPTKSTVVAQMYDYPGTAQGSSASIEDQFAAIRAELEETRVLIHTTELEARSLRRSIRTLVNRANGNSFQTPETKIETLPGHDTAS